MLLEWCWICDRAKESREGRELSQESSRELILRECSGVLLDGVGYVVARRSLEQEESFAMRARASRCCASSSGVLLDGVGDVVARRIRAKEESLERRDRASRCCASSSGVVISRGRLARITLAQEGQRP